MFPRYPVVVSHQFCSNISGWWKKYVHQSQSQEKGMYTDPQLVRMSKQRSVLTRWTELLERGKVVLESGPAGRGVEMAIARTS